MWLVLIQGRNHPPILDGPAAAYGTLDANGAAPKVSEACDSGPMPLAADRPWSDIPEAAVVSGLIGLAIIWLAIRYILGRKK